MLDRDSVFSVAISPCGTKLASGGGDPYSGGGDCDIRVWSMETGACQQVLKAHTSVPACMLATDAHVCVTVCAIIVHDYNLSDVELMQMHACIAQRAGREGKIGRTVI